MSYQRDRDQFIAEFTAATGAGVDTARALLRLASTLQRLAEAQCNGDYPADNGERKVKPCPICDASWVPSSICGGRLARLAHIDKLDTIGTIRRALAEPSYLRAIVRDAGSHEARAFGEYLQARACPDCRAEARAREIIATACPSWQVVTQGDPRGCVLRLAPSHVERQDIDCGRARLIYVPARY